MLNKPIQALHFNLLILLNAREMNNCTEKPPITAILSAEFLMYLLLGLQNPTIEVENHLHLHVSVACTVMFSTIHAEIV